MQGDIVWCVLGNPAMDRKRPPACDVPVCVVPHPIRRVDGEIAGGGGHVYAAVGLDSAHDQGLIVENRDVLCEAAGQGDAAAAVEIVEIQIAIRDIAAELQPVPVSSRDAADPVASGGEVVVTGTADPERVGLRAGLEQGEAGEDSGTAEGG